MEDKTTEKLAEAFHELDNCVAVAVSGSRTSQIHDSLSDWDIYVYREGTIDRQVREEILSAIGDSHLVGSSFFEEGDEFIRDGVYYDVMYRDPEFIRQQIDRVWVNHQCSLGYTTCFLHNLKTSSFIFDKTGISDYISVLDEPYPDGLSEAIIDYNLRMICGSSEGSWMAQVTSAVRRGDFVSRNHRLAALMASYFDIIFAHNRVLHPGEKKLIRYCHLLCSELPENFDEDMERIYSSAYEGDLPAALTAALGRLKDLVRRT